MENIEDLNYREYLNQLDEFELNEEEETVYSDCVFFNNCEDCPHAYKNHDKCWCELMTLNSYHKATKNN